jgi:hypothetical protein
MRFLTILTPILAAHRARSLNANNYGTWHDWSFEPKTQKNHLKSPPAKINYGTQG